MHQGLQNLVDRNEYITNNFIKRTEANIERICEFGAACRRLTELIDYSGGSLPLKSLALAAVGSAEAADIDAGGENDYNKEQDTLLEYFSTYSTEKQIAIRLLDTQVYNKLEIKNLDDRKIIIQAILDNKPYLFDSLYILNTKSGADYQRQMFYILLDIKYTNYVNMVKEVGGWYVLNVDTYCCLNREEYDEVVSQQIELQSRGIGRGDPGWISTTDQGRQGYDCTLDGNLNDLRVYDDCSSFVTACLIQSGFLGADTEWYSSTNYIGGSGDASQALKDAGFVWHPVSEMTEEEQRSLQPGDIMVKQGHVQIFDHFNNEDNPLIYAYTWGHICKEEPTESCRWSYFAENYEGIWRLEN